MNSNTTRRVIDERRRKFSAMSEEDLPDNDLGRLYRRAISEYGTTCLWNCRPAPDEDGLSVIADRLMKYGDLRAWYLAEEVLNVIGVHAHAPGHTSV